MESRWKGKELSRWLSVIIIIIIIIIIIKITEHMRSLVTFDRQYGSPSGSVTVPPQWTGNWSASISSRSDVFQCSAMEISK